MKQQLEVQVAELTCEQRRLKEEISGLEEKLSVSAKEVSRLGTSAGDAARLKVQLQQLEDKIHGRINMSYTCILYYSILILSLSGIVNMKTVWVSLNYSTNTELIS